MQRDLESELNRWKTAIKHIPLLIRGARHVGKTHLVSTFGQSHFKDVFTINFEKEPAYKAVFDALNPDEILNRLYLQSGKKLIPGKPQWVCNIYVNISRRQI
jgi:uncharacterized protein